MGYTVGRDGKCEVKDKAPFDLCQTGLSMLAGICFKRSSRH